MSGPPSSSSPFREPATLTLDRFVEERNPAWQELDELLTGARLWKKTPSEISRVARLYREVCTDLVRAQRLGCAPSTLAYLDALVSRGHSTLYATGTGNLRKFGQLLRKEFPRALRNNFRLFALSNVLFWLPFAVALARSLGSEQFAAQVLPLEMLEQMAEAYQGELGDGRTPGGNAAMAGFYVYNNVGIAFRSFATGILFGVGSAFFLVYNGAVTGAVMGHVIRTGGGPNILTFISGHAPLELTAIVIAGGAGLQMGRALVVTRGKTRLGSLWAEREPIVAQVLGAAMMLLLAALIEGFWSPSRAPAELKWGMGVVLLCLVAAYLGLAGRTPKGAITKKGVR